MLKWFRKIIVEIIPLYLLAIYRCEICNKSGTIFFEVLALFINIEYSNIHCCLLLSNRIGGISIFINRKVKCQIEYWLP
jgi:hypothetical protein